MKNNWIREFMFGITHKQRRSLILESKEQRDKKSIKIYNIANDILIKKIKPELIKQNIWVEDIKYRNEHWLNLEPWIRGGIVSYNRDKVGLSHGKIRAIDQTSSYLGCLTERLPKGQIQRGKGPDGCFQLIKLKPISKIKIKKLYKDLQIYIRLSEYVTLDEYKVWTKYFDFGKHKIEYCWWWEMGDNYLKNIANEIYKNKKENKDVKQSYCIAIGKLAEIPYRKGETNYKTLKKYKIQKNTFCPQLHIAILSYSRIKQIQKIFEIYEKGGELLISAVDCVIWNNGPKMTEVSKKTKSLGEYYPVFNCDMTDIYIVCANGYMISNNGKTRKVAKGLINHGFKFIGGQEEVYDKICKWILQYIPIDKLEKTLQILNNDKYNAKMLIELADYIP